MSPLRRTDLPGVATAFALAVVAVLFWLPYAAFPSLVAAGAAAPAGVVAGRRLGGTRLRWWVLVAGSLAAAALATLLQRAVLLLPLETTTPSPEALAAGLDAGWVGLQTLLAVSLLVALAVRRASLRGVPALMIVVFTAALLAAHRGGSIHLPAELSDFAWVRGWHPGLLLAVSGAGAALVGALAMIRYRRARWPLLHAGLISLLMLGLLSLVPGLGVFHFSDDDPLGLEGRRSDTEGESWIERPASEGPEGRRGDDDPLGLRGGETSDGPQEEAPFLDEYDQSRANSPVAVVVLHDDVEPAGGVFYFRQVAFSRWNGRRLVRSLERGIDADIFGGFPRAAPLVSPVLPPEGLRSPVPATVSLLREHRRPPVLADGVRLEPATPADPALFVAAFDSLSYVRTARDSELFGREAGDPSWPTRLREIYTETPLDPRYAELARSIAGSLRAEYRDDPWARALSVGLWLQENTLYSLRSRHAGAADPTASYLFGDRVGYCVHLAHAGALLMRELGLPARVAAGYAYLAENRSGGSALLLRSGDAHAWAEVYLRGAGWVAVDPAPPSIDPPGEMPDQDLQRLLGQLSRPAGPPELQLGRARPRWPGPAALLRALALMGLAVWLALQTIRLWRRTAPSLAGDDPRARLVLRAALDRLSELGLVRREGESWESFSRRAKSRAPSLPLLIDGHLAASFGRRAVPRQLAISLGAGVAKETRAGSLGRRLIAWLLPWHWTRTR